MSKIVLIAEDDPHIIESLSFIISRAGYDVKMVMDGQLAVQEVLRLSPAVLILDVMLPGKSGFEVLKILKADHTMQHIPVLLLTAKGQEQDRRTAEQLGADAFVSKPFSNKDVVNWVHRLAKVKSNHA